MGSPMSGEDPKPLPEDLTKPINPFGSKPIKPLGDMDAAMETKGEGNNVYAQDKDYHKKLQMML